MKLKHVAGLATIFSVALLGSSEARAQSFGAGGMISIPLSECDNDSVFCNGVDDVDFVVAGLGLVGEYEMPLNPQLSAIGTGGFVFAVLGDDISDVVDLIYYIPLLGGVKYHVNPQIYAFGQAGLNIAGGSAEDFDIDTETDLALNFGGGISLGQIDIRGSFWIPTIDEFDIGLTVWGIFKFGGGAQTQAPPPPAPAPGPAPAPVQ